MTLFKCQEKQLRISTRQRYGSRAAARAVHPVLAALALVAITFCASPGSQAFAAPEGARSVPAAVVPSTGTTATPSVSAQGRASPHPSSLSGSLSGSGQAHGRCARLREQYAQSQACFARYRMKNRGLRPGAFQHCKQLKDPSMKCGVAVVR